MHMTTIFFGIIINVDLKKSQRRKDNENTSVLLRCFFVPWYCGVITKWDGYYKVGRFYYKVERVLQSGTILLQSGTAFVITKWDRLYYKVGQLLLLQSGTILLQSGTGITKWDDYYKVGFNNISYSTDLKLGARLWILKPKYWVLFHRSQNKSFDFT